MLNSPGSRTAFRQKQDQRRKLKGYQQKRRRNPNQPGGRRCFYFDHNNPINSVPRVYQSRNQDCRRPRQRNYSCRHNILTTLSTVTALSQRAGILLILHICKTNCSLPHFARLCELITTTLRQVYFRDLFGILLGSHRAAVDL